MKFNECKICNIKVRDTAHLTRHLASTHNLNGKTGLEEYFLKQKSPITVSIGLTKHINDEDSKPCFQRADKALYEAKESGRNKTILL